MDTERSTGHEARPEPSSASPEREVTASPDEETSSEELQEEIRRTRVEMSQTFDALEERLHPERLKEEARARAEEVKDRVHPQRIAERAGEAMLDTIRDHPITSLIAGLSVGYLVKKSGERASERDEYGRSRRRYARREGRYEPAYYRERGYAESGYQRAPTRSYRDEEGPSMRERAQEQAGEMGERISETASHMQERAGEMGHRVQDRMEHARGGLDEFVSENPLAAGAIALGLGALLGGAMPSTAAEDEWIGPMRDEAADRAEEAARRTMEQAGESAERVASKAQEAAGEVSETVKKEAQEVKETATTEAKKSAEQVGGKPSQRRS